MLSNVFLQPLNSLCLFTKSVPEMHMRNKPRSAFFVVSIEPGKIRQHKAPLSHRGFIPTKGGASPSLRVPPSLRVTSSLRACEAISFVYRDEAMRLLRRLAMTERSDSME